LPPLLFIQVHTFNLIGVQLKPAQSHLPHTTFDTVFNHRERPFQLGSKFLHPVACLDGDPFIEPVSDIYFGVSAGRAAVAHLDNGARQPLFFSLQAVHLIH